MIYKFLLNLFTKPEDRVDASAGYLQGVIRDKVLSLCQGLSGKLLDIGCGEGLLLERLAKSNQKLELFGVDSNEKRLYNAKKRVGGQSLPAVKLTLADAKQLPFGSIAFENILLINFTVVLGISDLRLVLKEAARVLKKGGRIIFDIRNKNNLLLNLKYKLSPYYDETLGGAAPRAYCEKEVEKLLIGCGFEILKTTKLGFTNPVIIFEAEKL